jgi:cell division septation protein DedD
MTEEMVDDQSHYEISLTAGQAFLAFVLLLLSLAASFAFGLMIGKGQGDERLIVRKEPAVIQEGSILGNRAKSSGRIVDVADSRSDGRSDSPEATDTTATTPVVAEDPAPTTVTTDSFAASAATPAGSSSVPDSTVAPAAKPLLTESVKPAAVDNTPARPAVATPRTDAPAVKAVTPVPTAATRPAASSSVPRTEAKPASATHTPYYAQLLSTYEKTTAESMAAKLIDGGYTGAYVERTTSEKGTVYRVRIKYLSEADARAAAERLKPFSKDVWVTK